MLMEAKFKMKAEILVESLKQHKTKTVKLISCDAFEGTEEISVSLSGTFCVNEVIYSEKVSKQKNNRLTVKRVN